jgi:D-alanine-D-alanine ligase-like ATP-grasp enzyme
VHPKGRVINSATEAVSAADGLRYPVLAKPNVGGSGAGIVSFESPDALGVAASAGELEFGPDDTALVQEHLTAQDDAIVRIEFLDGEFLYAIRLRLTPGTFNLCPADYCDNIGIADTATDYVPIEAFKPPPEIIRDAKRILDATGADLGGVEYLIDAATGDASYYDINALSNFVADAPTIVGFDPFIDLVDFIEERAGLDDRMSAVV